jgi:peptidyl-prolyl cis-trans isomerase D
MLKVMQSNRFFSVFILGGIVFIITISFLFWGVGPNNNQTATVIASVGGDRILLDDFYQRYDNELRRLREVYKSDEEIEKLNLKETVLANMIDRMVLLITADDMDISVTEDELKNAIISIPYFQSNGRFDPNLYERTLSQNRMTPQAFESEFKNDLLITKMSRLIGETAELTADEKKILESITEGKAQLTETFLATKRTQAVQAYIEGQRKKLDISIDDSLLM